MKHLHTVTTLVLLGSGTFIALLLAAPHWTNWWSYKAHLLFYETTGMDWLIRKFPERYTGLMRTWYPDGTLCSEMRYSNGLRHGIWRRFDSKGKIVTEGDYRYGYPWDGMCYVYEFKGWIGEYRRGIPWNGFLPGTNAAGIGTQAKWLYYLDGAIVDEDVYMSTCRFPN